MLRCGLKLPRCLGKDMLVSVSPAADYWNLGFSGRKGFVGGVISGVQIIMSGK